MQTKTKIKTLTDAAEALWGVVANVSGGDWNKQNRIWREAATRARQDYHNALNAKKELSASEALFGFFGWLTTRKTAAGPFSANTHPGEAVELIKIFCETNKLKDPKDGWEKLLKHPKQ